MLKFFILASASLLIAACAPSSQNQMADTYLVRAENAATRYYIAQDTAGQIDLCVLAHLAAASYSKAGVKIKYATWRAVETLDCAIEKNSKSSKQHARGF